MKKLWIAMGMALLLNMPLLANDIRGVWLRDNGKSKITLADCGGGWVCSKITWLQDPGAMDKFKNTKILGSQNGRFKLQGSTWSGTIYNPEDGKTYSATASVSGNTLSLKGGYKVLGTVVGKTATFTRSN
ncbi:MAG: DUF2147 domain-containing protein [Spirochaetales bacterium]|nr:DUF2147 domain-containing protein [Spirochaetales bacterium]